jgi:hypothetical protein
MAVEAPRRLRSLKKLAMPVREARWWCRSLLNRLEQESPIGACETIWHLSRVAQVAAIAQQRETPGGVAVCNHKPRVVHRSCAHSRMVARLTKRREPRAKSYLATNHWEQHTLYESLE